MNPAGLFPPGPHRFRLIDGRRDAADFFLGRESSGSLLAERRRWLAEAPARYAVLRDEGGEAWCEFLSLAAAWTGSSAVGIRPEWKISEAGRELEPDLLILARETVEAAFRLQGGALCFPTGWSLEENLGATLDEIHAIVPGLNATLGPAIARFLAGLRPGVAYGRENWGIAATRELNLHPIRRIPPPQPPVDLANLWLRVEHQTLLALPRSGAVAFGIRLSLHPLDKVAGTPTGVGLRRALQALPEDLAAYKRLDGIRERLIAELG